MRQASRAVLMFLGVVLVVHVAQGSRNGQGFGQARRWVVMTLTGHDPSKKKGK